MTDTDRARVGRALDLIRDALAPYVDSAMTTAYSANWDDRIATEDAKRRASGRRYPVSKTDLAVLLKVLQHERLAPWWDPRSDPAGRIRSFASELLTLRNLYAHGDECSGEHDRLLDTAGRLLRMLGLPIPGGLEPNAVNSEAPAIPAPTPLSIYDSRLADEVHRLGPTGVRLAEIWTRYAAIADCYVTGLLDPLAVADGRSEPGRGLIDELGPEVLDLLDETEAIEGRVDDHSIALRAYVLATRAQLVDFPLRDVTVGFLVRSAERYEKDADSGIEINPFIDRINRFTELLEGRVALWSEVVALARQLNDGELLPNILVVLGNFELENPSDPDDALRLTRDSVERARLLAAIDPGSDGETTLVRLLRREGALCNDLGRSDEAIRAFARADEIIDRYPTADPELMR